MNGAVRRPVGAMGKKRGGDECSIEELRGKEKKERGTRGQVGSFMSGRYEAQVTRQCIGALSLERQS